MQGTIARCRKCQVDPTFWEYLRRVTLWPCGMNGECGVGSSDWKQLRSLKYRVGGGMLSQQSKAQQSHPRLWSWG